MDSTFLMFFVLVLAEADGARRQRFRDGLDEDGRRRRDRRIPRIALTDPSLSPWQYIYNSRNDQAMITTTGFDCDLFQKLLDEFVPYFDSHTPWSNDGSIRPINRNAAMGRPRLVNAASGLAIALVANRTKGSLFMLQSFFGFTGTPVGVWLQFSRRMICVALENNRLARIAVPSKKRIKELQEITASHYPSLDEVYAVADGLKLPIESASDPEIQSQFYNGWTHDTYVTNLLVFSVCGRIIMAVFDCPGSMHDSSIASYASPNSIYDRVEEIYNKTGGKVCMDSAFAAVESPAIIQSSQDVTASQTPFEVIQHRDATSLRQAAEWGMRAVQSSFPRLKDRMKYEERHDRYWLLYQAILLYNYRLETVGLNQLRNTFVLAWSEDADDLIESYL